MKLLVVLLIILSLSSIQAKNGVKLQCLANSCQSCTSDSNCVWCDNRCIDKNAYVLCTKRISESAKCKESTKNYCEYKGQRYDIGKKFMDDCNNCTCLEGGSVSCTLKLCSDCNYNGKTYHNGDSFPSSDNCNSCSCNNGLVICTLRACLQTCNYQGEIYTDGQTFPAGDGCNSCTCVSGEARCTDMACIMNCQSDKDCNSGFFCSKSSCDTSLQGTCMNCNRDTICTAQYDPVCGCDGKNYSNNCAAMRSCVNVKSTGECKSNANQPQPTSCQTDKDCNSGYFCSKASCDASSRGSCTECKRDRICTALYDPVCGCDNNTYSNQCVATRSCVNVKRQGECQSTTPQPLPLNCRTNSDCGPENYCAKLTCDCDQGTCTQRNLGCNRLYDPVCGCDRKTYSNQCEAGRLGANVKSRGECPTQSGGKSLRTWQ